MQGPVQPLHRNPRSAAGAAYAPVYVQYSHVARLLSAGSPLLPECKSKSGAALASGAPRSSFARPYQTIGAKSGVER